MSNLSFIPYELTPNPKADLTVRNLLTHKEDHSFAVFGYPDDEGILYNGGKVGAALGPDAIRTSLYKMAAHHKTNYSIKDLGNLSFQGASLEERHQYASEQVLASLKKKKVCIGLGGGHDYGFVDGAAFLRHNHDRDLKPLIVNFDAHFDLRNLDKGITSGTPFFRLIEDFKDSFELIEVGIQKHCNSSHLFEYAKEKPNIKSLEYNDLYPRHSFDFDYFKRQIPISKTHKRPCYISIDIDGFSSAFAPGCSQSWPTGFDIKSFFQMFDYLLEHFEVQVLGVYEVSPPLDHTELTSRLAALILYRFFEVYQQEVSL